MLLEQLKSFPKEVQDTFSKIANQLLSCNYIAKDKKDNTKAYYFVVNYKQYFDEFFSLLQNELVIDNDLGCVQLKNNYLSNNFKLRKEDTFVLLILRILYQEKLINTTLGNTVSITIDEIHSKYQSFGFKRKIFKTDLIQAIRLFKKYNIIDNIGDIALSTSKLLIFPTITMLIPVMNISECYSYIVELESGKGDEEQDENIN